MYVSRLKKNLFFFFFTLTHSNYLSQKRNTFHSPFYFFLHTQLSLLAVFFFSKQLPLDCSLFFFLSCAVSSLFSFAHTLFVSSQRRQYFALSSLAIFLNAVISYSLIPLAFLPSENPFSLSWFHALFSLSS